jgi:hypothetical protein
VTVFEDPEEGLAIDVAEPMLDQEELSEDF